MKRLVATPALIVVGALVTATLSACPNEVAASGCPPAGCKKPEPEEPPRLFIDPPFGLGYDCVTIGCDNERTLTVENRGGGKVRLSLVRLSVDTSPDFSIRRGDDGPLPFDEDTAVDVTPDTPLTLLVRYAPTDGDGDTGKVLVDWYDGALDFADAVVTNVELPLSTRELGGVAATLVEPRLNFGFVDVGGEVRRDIVVRNAGDGGVLSIGPVTLEDGTAPVFVEPSPGDWGEHFVNPGDEVRIPVAFRPDATAAFLGALQVRTSDGGSPSLRVEVAGTAVAEPRVLLSTTAIEFGAVRVGVPRTESITVTNTGGAPLTFLPAVVSGAGVLLSSTDPVTVSPLESASVDVVWTPVAGGAFTGAVQLSTDDPTQPQATVTLEGFANAPLLSAQPASIDFGGVVQGWTTGAQTFLLSNTGFGELTVNSISFEVGASSQIVLTDVPGLPIKLTPGEPPIAISVFMTASTLGTQQATILVGSDSVDGPLGTGGVGRLNVSGRVITCEEGCPVNNGQPSCATGSCAIATCNTTFHDANDGFGDGCECGEDLRSGGLRRDIEGSCNPGLNIGPLGDDCASVREVRRSGNTLHDERDVDVYFFHATDESRVFGCDGFGDSFGVRVRLEGAPSGMRLCAVQQANGTGCGGENQRRCVNAGNDLFFGGGNQLFGGSDTSDFTVWVEWAPGVAPQCGNYTLFVKGNDG
jgi:hypothetical protein